MQCRSFTLVSCVGFTAVLLKRTCCFELGGAAELCNVVVVWCPLTTEDNSDHIWILIAFASRPFQNEGRTNILYAYFARKSTKNPNWKYVVGHSIKTIPIVSNFSCFPWSKLELRSKGLHKLFNRRESGEAEARGGRRMRTRWKCELRDSA